MSKQITLINDNVPDFIQSAGVSALTKQLAGEARFKRIVPKNGIFRKVVGGEEMGKVKGDLNVVIVNASPHVGRIFYSSQWTPDAEPTAPDCFSNDGRSPDPEAASPQATRCDACPQNIKGSGQGQSKACRYSRRIAVMLEDDFGTALEGEVYQMNLASKTLFGDSGSDRHFTFENYAKYFANNGKSVDHFVTQLSFNEHNDNQSVLFSPVRYITKDEYMVTSKAAESEAVRKMVVMTPYQADASGRKALPADTAESAPKQTAAMQEPVKRETKAAAPQPAAAKRALNDVVKAWSDDE